MDVDLTDGQVHDLELYFLDWDRQGRMEQVQISDATTGAVLSTQAVSAFQSGAYLDYAVRGNIVITITKGAGTSNVLSGLFLDPASHGRGDVPEAGHDDAGQLDGDLRHPGLRRDRRPLQPAELRQRHARGRQ